MPSSPARWLLFGRVLESSPRLPPIYRQLKDKVVADMRREARGKASGASVAWSYWQVFTFRDGKALRFEWFADRAEALEAVGLRE